MRIMTKRDAADIAIVWIGLSSLVSFLSSLAYTLAFVFAMNLDAYNGLPEDLRAVIDANSGVEFSAFAGRTHQAFDAPVREVAVERGNNIITLSPDQVDDWRAAAAPTVDTWIGEMNDRDIDGAALVDQARTLIAKHTDAQ